MRSNEELKQLALDIYSGEVFTDKQCENKSFIDHIFMPLAFMDKKARKQFNKNKPFLIFEYINKACPVAINGMPTFLSCQYLDKESFEKMQEYYKKIADAVDKV